MKKLLSIFLCVCVLLSSAIIAVNAEGENPNNETKYEDKFLEQYNINKEKLNPEEYSYSELYYHTNDKEEIDWVLVDAYYGAPCAVEVEESIGNIYLHSGGLYSPFDLRYGVYDVKEERFYKIKDYKNKPGKVKEIVAALKEIYISSAKQEYEDRFFEQYNFDKENISPEDYHYSELYYHKDSDEEIDWVLVRAYVGGSGDMFTSATIGNRFISSNCDSMPFRTQYGIYSVKEDKFYDIISYKSANIKTEDLEAVLKQHGIGTEFSGKYEGVFLDQYNSDFDIENLSPEDYHYSELYYHKNSADEVDWALVEAYVMPCGAMETSATVGNRFIHSFSYYNPFLTKYGIYNAEDNQFYDITSYKNTNVKTEDLEAALRELNIGTEVSEKITPELREILNKKTNIYDNIAEIGIELNIDFNKDGLEHYIYANVLGADKDANIFAKHYREEVKKRISAQVQEFIDDNAGNFYEIQYQGDTLGVVIARAYAYNVDKIAEDERVKSIDCGENIQPYNENLWKYEKKFIEQYEMDKFEPNVFGYVYDELYYHQDKDGEIDWALVKGDSGMQLCAETDIFVGNLKIHSNAILSPFETGYGVYDVKEDKFYDINDYQNVPGKLDELVSVLKELGIGEEVTETSEPIVTNPIETTPEFTDPPVTNPNESTPNVTDPITTNPVVTEPAQPTTSSPTIKAKQANPIKVTVKAKTVKLKKLKKKAQKVKAITVKNNVGKVTYKLVKKGITKKIRKFVKINSKGVITIKKWKKAKKGTYKIKVKITAAGNTNFNAKTVTKTIKVKII